jgi:hypothetical protein
VRARMAFLLARASNAIAWANSEPTGNGRCVWESVLRMLASTAASLWPDSRPATKRRSR